MALITPITNDMSRIDAQSRMDTIIDAWHGLGTSAGIVDYDDYRDLLDAICDGVGRTDLKFADLAVGIAAREKINALAEVLDDPIQVLGSDLYEFWYAGDTMTLNGANIASWAGRKVPRTWGNTDDATRPTFDADGLNAGPVALFNGTDQFLHITPSPFPTGTGAELEMWAVVDQAVAGSDAATRTIMGIGSTAGENAVSIRRIQGSGNINRANISVGYSTDIAQKTLDTIDFSGDHVVRGVVGATASYIEVDGVASDPVSVVPLVGSQRARLGARPNGTGAANYWSGGIGAAAITKPLSTGKANWLRQHLNGLKGL